MSSPQPWRIVGEDFLLMVRLTPKAAKDAVDGIAQDPAPPASATPASMTTSEKLPAPAKSPAPVAQPQTSHSHLKVRVRAVPEKGKANAALEKLIAKWLGLPKSAVHITAGGKSRIKTLKLDADHADLTARLAARLKMLKEMG